MALKTGSLMFSVTELFELILSAFSLVDALPAFLCNGVDFFGPMCVIFLFPFFTHSLSLSLSLSVLLFSDILEDSVNLD